MALNLSGTVVATFVCERCEGEGRGDKFYEAHCGSCNRNYTREEQFGWDFSRPHPTMPCGCDYDRYFREDNTCPDCEGRGQLVQTVTLADIFAAFKAQEGAGK